jgi:hypothetical protein
MSGDMTHEMRHAEGLLHVSGPEKDNLTVYIDTEAGRPVCAMNGFHDDAEANARRLVAAWNACGGIPTENLELAKYAATIAFLKTVEQQRDELLEALKEAAETLDRCRYSEQPMAKKCFALIAKMEKP